MILSGIFCAVSENNLKFQIPLESAFFFHISFAIFPRAVHNIFTHISHWQALLFRSLFHTQLLLATRNFRHHGRLTPNLVIKEERLFAIQELFEAHLTVLNLPRAMKFYGDVLGLEPASVFPEHHAAFYWLGGRGKSMLGLWEVGSGPQRMHLHTAFCMELPHLLQAAAKLKAANVTPCDFERRPTDEPDVLAWMPAASLYFDDPDGNQLEFIAMLPGTPRPELGVLRWSEWKKL